MCDGRYILSTDIKLRSVSIKKQYIVHCCDDKNVLMHDEDHDVDIDDF